MILETTITIGSSEVPATVEFDFYKGYVARAPRGEAFALEPGEPASVEINSITLHNLPGTRPHMERIPVTITDGLLFDAMADEWLKEQCLEHVSEDA